MIDKNALCLIVGKLTVSVLLAILGFTMICLAYTMVTTVMLPLGPIGLALAFGMAGVCGVFGLGTLYCSGTIWK